MAEQQSSDARTAAQNVAVAQAPKQMKPLVPVPYPNVNRLILNPSKNQQLKTAADAKIPIGNTPGAITVPPTTKVGQG